MKYIKYFSTRLTMKYNSWMYRHILSLLLFTGTALSSNAQHLAISNNLIFDAMGALSAGVEIPYHKNTSFDQIAKAFTVSTAVL